ncbi:MAG: DUF1501 domain-containing protein [Pirellulales bacterium]
MLHIRGRYSRTCGGLSRRSMLQAAGAGLLGLSLPKVLAAESAGVNHPARARSVIFLFLFGGPSQYETFDMKPEASSEIRGPFRPIRARNPDLRICEHLPLLADASDKFCVIRSMTHDFNDHSGGAHYIQTGHRWHVPIGAGFSATSQDWPSIGSAVDYVSHHASTTGPRSDVPNYAVVPNRLGRLQDNGQYLRPGEYAGWLGRAYNPLTTKVDRLSPTDNPYWRNCSDDELSGGIEGLAMPTALELSRIEQRSKLLKEFDAQRRIVDSQLAGEIDGIRQRALDLMTSSRTRDALDLQREPARARDRYGRHLFGQSTLMARRLVEAGVRFVTVHYDACDGYSWDSHVHSHDVRDRLLPTFDQTLSALLIDLDERGLLAETLVVALGEMGRTAQPTKEWGRGHWSTLFPAVIAGAGIRGGQVWGASDRTGQYPIEHPTSPEDLAATIYHAMGIDPQRQLLMPDGRPTPLVPGGQPVRGLWS